MKIIPHAQMRVRSKDRDNCTVAKKCREKFCLSPRKFGRSFYLNFRFAYIYIFTSPSAENREKFVHLGRLFLSSRPVGYSRRLIFSGVEHLFIIFFLLLYVLACS